MRYVLYGGKGGVGKTTCAAATGLGLAARGERTLLVSTDPAHSLGDALDVDLGGDPTRVEADLWAVEADPEAGQATYRRVVEALAAEFRDAGVRLPEEDVERLFAAGLVPGSDEVAALRYLDAHGGGEYDRVVLDTAPTGHTLRLLALPDVMAESLSVAGRLQGEVRRLVTAARSAVLGPAAFLRGDDGDDEVAAFRERMERVRGRLRDPDSTEFRVVLTPEAMAVSETRGLVDELRSFDVPLGGLVVNRVLESPTEGCPRCERRRAGHERALASVREAFPELAVRTLPEVGPEVDGRDDLRRLADRLVG